MKINVYQNDGTERVWRSKEIAHDPEQTTSSVEQDGAVLWPLQPLLFPYHSYSVTTPVLPPHVL